MSTSTYWTTAKAAEVEHMVPDEKVHGGDERVTGHGLMLGASDGAIIVEGFESPAAIAEWLIELAGNIAPEVVTRLEQRAIHAAADRLADARMVDAAGVERRHVGWMAAADRLHVYADTITVWED